jgi:Rrf2 family protein
MFRINRKTDYAVRVMLSLASRSSGTRLPTRTIQEEMLIPRPILQRIIAELAHYQLVQTTPGPGGGVQLARPAEAINLRHIWEAIEGPIQISDCLKADVECPLELTCPVQSRWGRLQSLLIRELEATTVAQLASEAASLHKAEINSAKLVQQQHKPNTKGSSDVGGVYTSLLDGTYSKKVRKSS